MSLAQLKSEASELQNNVVIQRVELADKAAMQRIGELHMELLSAWGPMTALGERFVREACYGVNMRDGLLEVDLLEIDGRPAGFVAYTAASLDFHRNSLKAHWSRVVAELAWALLSKPTRLLGLLRALGVIASRRSEEAPDTAALGEIVCIGVRPEFLSAKFIRSSGVRASELLIQHAAAYMRRAGVNHMRMLVDKPNKAALFLYHKLGASFKDFSQAGAPMVEVTFDLEKTALAIAPDMPKLWSIQPDESSQEGAGGWRKYWEKVADNEKIFRYEAEDYCERFQRNVPLKGAERILDFGCGYGFIAATFAARGHAVAVWDASSNARRQTMFRMAMFNNVSFLDLSQAENCAKHAGAFDLITVHSVIQYMSTEELRNWLQKWRQMLAPGGRLLISDVITPAVGTLPELLSLITLSVKKRFFLRAVWECLRETPTYWRARNSLSLNRVEAEKWQGLMEAAGYSGFEQLQENLSHRQARLSLVFKA